MDVMSLDTGNITGSISHLRLISVDLRRSIQEASDSYILRSISDPKVHVGVKREEFFKSLLNKKHADELLTGALFFVERMDE